MATEIRRLSDSIWCMRRASYLTCSYMVRTPHGIVVVDAGMDSAGEEVLTGLKAMGADIGDIRAVLLTHWHNDHSAGAREVQIRSGAEVYYHRDDEPWFTGRAGAKGWRKRLSARRRGPHGEGDSLLVARSARRRGQSPCCTVSLLHVGQSPCCASWQKWLNRRSRQRGSMNWERFGTLLREHLPLPLPRVVHSICTAKA